MIDPRTVALHGIGGAPVAVASQGFLAAAQAAARAGGAKSRRRPVVWIPPPALLPRPAVVRPPMPDQPELEPIAAQLLLPLPPTLHRRRRERRDAEALLLARAI